MSLNNFILKQIREKLTDDVSYDISTDQGKIKKELSYEQIIFRKKDYYRVERSYGSFCRSFWLPENVNGDKVKASFKDGVLVVRLPKSKELLPGFHSRNIFISLILSGPSSPLSSWQ